jgi:undecaprenyl-diphosphatase
VLGDFYAEVMPLHTARWLALAVLAIACYALLWLGWALHWKWLATADWWMLNPLHDYGVKHPPWVRFWDVLCAVLGPTAFRIFAIGVVVFAALRRNLRVVVFVAFAIGFSGVVTLVAKSLADRPRPPTALVAASGSSFPSGHALAVMAAVLALLAISAGLFGRRGRTLSIVVGVVVVLAVGAGRVVLNVHHPSDVVAGWALGYLWYLCCLLVIRPLPLADAIGEAGAGTPQARGTERKSSRSRAWSRPRRRSRSSSARPET